MQMRLPDTEPGITIQPGVYQAVVSAIDENWVNQKTGKTAMVVEWSVDTREGVAKVKEFYHYSEKAMFRIQFFFKALGLPYTGNVDIPQSQILGRQAQLVIDFDESGKYNEVVRVEPSIQQERHRPNDNSTQHPYQQQPPQQNQPVQATGPHPTTRSNAPQPSQRGEYSGVSNDDIPF